MKKKSGMKKLAIAFGVFVALLLTIIITVPLFVNVDKYRPQIVQAANEKINGTLELGKLSLSLWGQVHVQVAGMTLKDAAGKPVVSVKDAFFHIPFTSLFSGSPILTFKMKEPFLNVIKDARGKLNVMSLVKEEPANASSGTPSAQAPTGAQPSGKTELPAIATRARLGVELRSAVLSYKDMGSGLSSEVKDLNLVVKDISLTRPMDLELWADLNTRMGKTLTVKGPARIQANAKPELKGSSFDRAEVTALVNLDDLEIDVPGTFHKSKGVPTHASVKLIATEKTVNLESMGVIFAKLEMNGSGKVELAEAGPVIQEFGLKSNNFELAPWADLVPMLKAYELGGTGNIQVSASGPASKLYYTANIGFSQARAKLPSLKVQPKFDGVIHVVPDAVDKIQISMKAPGTDANIQGKVNSFSKPRVEIRMNSSGMDLDQLMDFTQPSGKPTSFLKLPVPELIPLAEAAPASAPPQDLDAMLAPMRQNPMMLGLVANLFVDMKHLKVKNTKISDLSCKFNFNNLAGTLESCALGLFSGKVNLNGGFDLKPQMPTYQFSGKVSSLDLNQAVVSQMEFLKNTIKGRANFSITGNGASFNTDTAMSRLNAKGDMKVEDATFATIDVGKMVAEGLNKSVEKLGDKVPALKGRKIGNVPNISSKYEFISSDFSVSNLKFKAPNFFAKAEANKGIDLKGKTEVGIKDQTIDADWEVIDTYNITGARDLSVEQSGVKVEHILAEGSSPVRFPIHVGCTVKSPCYSYTQVPEFLAKIALNNVTQAVASKAKEEAKKHVESAVKNAIGNKLKGLFR